MLFGVDMLSTHSLTMRPGRRKCIKLHAIALECVGVTISDALGWPGRELKFLNLLESKRGALEIWRPAVKFFAKLI